MPSDPVAIAFRQSGSRQGDFGYWHKPGPPSSLVRFVSAGEILSVARGAEGRRQNLVEAGARAWARQHGVAVPSVHAVAPDGSWMLAEYVPVLAAEGVGYVSGALAQADLIQRAPLPTLDIPSSTWQAKRTSFPVRLARLVHGGVSLRRVRTVKAAAAALPATATSHGDFYRRNVLAAGGDHVLVVDWEFLGSAPDFTDHLRLWSTLKDRDDRERVIEHIMASGADRAHVVTLARWLGLRLLLENLSAPADQRNPKDLAHARVVAGEAQRWSLA